MNDRDCATFDEQLDELAVGDLSEPARGRVLAHVATCDACRRRLDELLAITDRLLDLAPEHEPPPGFESRVLDRLTAAPAAAGSAGRWRRSRWVVAAAAAVLLTLAVAGVTWSRSDGDPAVTIARSGTILGADGGRVGEVALVRSSHPYVLVTIDHPRTGGNEVTCELELPDGSTLVAGTWGYADIRTGVWAVGIDTSSLGAVRMRIVSADGDVLATADLR